MSSIWILINLYKASILNPLICLLRVLFHNELTYQTAGALIFCQIPNSKAEEKSCSHLQRLDSIICFLYSCHDITICTSMGIIINDDMCSRYDMVKLHNIFWFASIVLAAIKLNHTIDCFFADASINVTMNTQEMTTSKYLYQSWDWITLTYWANFLLLAGVSFSWWWESQLQWLYHWVQWII